MTLAAADSVAGLPVSVGAVMRLPGETGAPGLVGGQAVPGAGSVHVDRLPPSVAAQFARDLAARVPATSVSGGWGVR